MSGRLPRRTLSSSTLPVDPGHEDLGTELVRRDLTFLRVVIESIYISDTDDYVAKLIQSKGLYGFVLEYQFPSLDSACKLLGNRIPANAKSYSNSIINFRHRRIFKLSLERKLWALWDQGCAVFQLYAQLNALGKFTKKLIARCDVSLRGLLSVPFGICDDYLFVGVGFTGSAQLRIELGSHVKSIMERLELLRNDGNAQLPSSRSTSRSRSRQSSVASLTRRRTPTFSPPPITRDMQASQSPEDIIPVQASSARSYSPSLSTFPTAVMTCPVPALPPNYRVHLTVHSAHRLPTCMDRGSRAAPSTYVSVIANDGHVLCSPICRTSFRPEFNWSQVFEVSEKRQNLVVKLWQKCTQGPDKVIGFVSIPLPPRSNKTTEYEMSNMTTQLETPMISVTLTSAGSSPAAETPLLVSSPNSNSSSPPLQISKEEISEKLSGQLKRRERIWRINKHEIVHIATRTKRQFNR